MKKSLVPLQHYLYMYPIIFTSYNLSISGKNLTKYHNIKLWKGGGGGSNHTPLSLVPICSYGFLPKYLYTKLLNVSTFIL